jgi:DNA-binding response OmpR family regulator
MAKILVVEDDLDLCETMCTWLLREQYLVERTHNGREAFELLKFSRFDAIILDWVLPDMHGIDVLRTFRKSGGQTPILMLTGRSNLDDKEAGLDSGADDYLTKPFQMRELMARVRSLLRRADRLVEDVITIRHITINPATHEVFRDGEEVRLAPKEFALLEFLMRHPGRVFTPDALLDRIWPSDSSASSETLRTCVARLRKKIDGEREADSIIHTVHGIGYKFDSESAS